MKKSFLILLLAATFAACQQPPQPWAPSYVVLIGLDGLTSACMRDTTVADIMPFVSTLFEKGSWALHKRSVLPSSSAPNWASLYMGAGPEQHGYNTWGSRIPDFPSDTLTEHGIFPDLYYQIKCARPDAKIAHFYEWEGMHYVIDTLSVDHDHQIRSTLDDMAYCADHIIQDKPLFTSIILDNPDHAGHTCGWLSPEYYATLHHLDSCVQIVYSKIEQAGMADSTLFIVTSDHGGIGYGHGSTSMNEMETPLFIVGKGIRADYEIPQTISICDVLPTVAWMLDTPRPHAWTGRPITSILAE